MTSTLVDIPMVPVFVTPTPTPGPAAGLFGHVATVGPENTLRPIAGARVCLFAPPATADATMHPEPIACTQTDEQGRYDMVAPPGRYVVVAHAMGFEREVKQVALEPGPNGPIDFVLNPAIAPTPTPPPTGFGRVDDKGKAHVSQSGHGGVGAAAGAGVGVLLGLIGGPAGLLFWTLGSSLLGGLAGKHLGHQFDADQLKALGVNMAPNTSAIVVVIEDQYAEAAAKSLGEYDAKVVTVTLGDQLSGEMATYAAVDLSEDADAATPAK